jgi:glycerophosphoryl diester phosphodiesterase
MSDPLYVENMGCRTWLKWHRARRTAADPEFTPTRILEAMRLGASVEVDLVIHADHGCAILHDQELERGTTGTGLVAETGADALRQFHLRGNDGEPIADCVMLLEDLCVLLSENPAHPEALLQLDFKESAARLDERTVLNFARSVAPVARHMILSGGDAEAIERLATVTPGLRTGYDPTYQGALVDLKTAEDFAAFVSKALETAPGAEMIYVDYELILAADQLGFDMISALHAVGRRVDAWTLHTTDDQTVPAAKRLVELKVDQITTDDPEALAKALT